MSCLVSKVLPHLYHQLNPLFPQLLLLPLLQFLHKLLLNQILRITNQNHQVSTNPFLVLSFLAQFSFFLTHFLPVTITTPRKISTGGPKISPKAIYSIHAPEGYRPSRPNSPTTTSETIDPPYRLPSHSRSYLATTTSPRKDEVIGSVLSAEVRGGGGKTFEKESSSTTPHPLISIERSPIPLPPLTSSLQLQSPSSPEISKRIPGGYPVVAGQTIDLLSDELPPSPPLPTPTVSSSRLALLNEISAVETGRRESSRDLVETGNLIDFEIPNDRHNRSEVNRQTSPEYVPSIQISRMQRLEGEVRRKVENEKEKEKESKTLTMLDESIQEIISLEAEIETVKTRAENDLEQIKSEYEGKLEKERKEVERLKKENEDLRKKREESNSSEEEEFVYESVEMRKEKMELEMRGTKFEDRENQIGFDRLRTREELLELARSPLVKECSEVYVEGVLPTQMDARNLRSQTKVS